MAQVIWNWVCILVLPLLAGAAIRFVCWKFSKAYIITIVAAILSVVAFIISKNPPVNGSELYGIFTLMAVSFTVGSFVVGLIARVKGKTPKSAWKLPSVLP